ncbi:MAG: aminotransferase, partial [Pseudomonadota bacterium]
DRGEGVWIYDREGNAFIEGVSGLWCASLGYGNHRLINAAKRQMEKLAYGHLFASKSTEPAIELAEKLIEIAPVPMGKVFLANSGSEANDTMIKMVRYFNNARGQFKRKKIISRKNGYHGVTLAAASLTGLDILHHDFDLPMEGILHTACPHYYRQAKEGESEIDFSTRLADELEKLIQKEGPDTIAAFIAEPVMGAGGVILPPEGYFEKIQAVLKRHDILFVADEVICGFGRLGSMWGSQIYDIRPDIITCAKALSAAYLPISAVLITESIADVISKNAGRLGSFGHGYTYSGHPVASAVGVETLKIYQEQNIIDHVQEVAPILQNGLEELSAHPLVGQKRGIGLIGALELVRDKATKTSFQKELKIAALLTSKAQDRGLIIRPLPGDVVALCPPLVSDQKILELIIDKLAAALDDVKKSL